MQWELHVYTFYSVSIYTLYTFYMAIHTYIKVQRYLASKHTDLSKPLEVNDQYVR
jgi:hypothetical protein